MTTALAKVLDIPFEANIDILKADEDEKGRWIIEGFASTTDRDLQDEVVTQDAINNSATDLEENSTVLLNHDQKIPIGRVLESEARKGGLFIKVLISKTVPDIWTRIKEGVLNKFSIRGKVIDAVKEWNEALGKFVKVIKKMFLVEVSLVSVPANPNAKALRWYIEKSLDLFESQGGELQTIDKSGGLDMKTGKGTATAAERTEEDGVPEIVKDEEGKNKKDGGTDEMKKDVSKMSDDELVKAASTHAALVKEKTEAVAKIANEIAMDGGKMTAQELRSKLDQLSDLGWRLGDDAKVVNIAGGGEAAKADETEKARGEGQGQGGPRQGDGGANLCKCPSCGETVEKAKGEPCVDIPCPKCGTKMVGVNFEKGFPTPDVLLSEWGEFCKKNDLAEELDEEKVFEKWVEFCKAEGYPKPYPYPYPHAANKADGEKAKEVMFLVDKLAEGADEKMKPVLAQIKALLSRMVGGAYPYPTPYPYPKKDDAAKAKKKPADMEGEEEEDKKKGVKKDGEGEDDIEKKGAKMKSSRLKTLKNIIEKLQGLLGELDENGGAAKMLDELTKNLADETKAEESLEELKKTLAVEARQSFSELLSPLEKRLERIESIEGIQKSEKGQETTPDDKSKTGKDGDTEEGGKPKKSVFAGILGESLDRARSGFRTS